MVIIRKPLLFTLIILVTSCIGRTDTYYDSIYIEESGTLIDAHKSTINIPNDGGETVLKVVIPWSPKLSVSVENDGSWLKARISSSEEPIKYSSTDNRLKADVYYVVYIIIETQRNYNNARSSTLTLSCPYRDNICKAEVFLKQN